MSYETAIAVILSTGIIGILWLATNVGNQLKMEQMVLFIFATALIWGSMVVATNMAEDAPASANVISNMERIQVFTLYMLYIVLAYCGITTLLAAYRWMFKSGTKEPEPFLNTR